MRTSETVIGKAFVILGDQDNWKKINSKFLPAVGFLEELVVAITVILLHAERATNKPYLWKGVGTMEEWVLFHTFVQTLIPIYREQDGWEEGIRATHAIEKWDSFREEMSSLMNQRDQ